MDLQAWVLGMLGCVPAVSGTVGHEITQSHAGAMCKRTRFGGACSFVLATSFALTSPNQ